ncbi:MAG: 50S ribosomal protein L11 methyltransferase, partial [Desulfohalobiaceae bacterium]|nr:50S ribosomal protein L11 methyltransferase [Desulfohalobiaceae bacterium]
MSEWVYRLQCDMPQARREELACFLWDNVSWGWEESQEENGCVTVYCTEYEQASSLARRLQQAFPDVSARVSRQENRQWHHVWRDFFQPVSVADTFLVLPSWQDPPGGAAERIPLFIYPEMAFGTGHHPTTYLCLEAIAELLPRDGFPPQYHCLDLGTGSGVLGIACAATGAWTLGVDNDSIAIHNARTNRGLNQVRERFPLVVGDLDCLSREAAFDLVLANILADPLLEMAEPLAGMLAPGGSLILSGLLQHQEGELIRAYSLAGLPEP